MMMMMMMMMMIIIIIIIITITIINRAKTLATQWLAQLLRLQNNEIESFRPYRLTRFSCFVKVQIFICDFHLDKWWAWWQRWLAKSTNGVTLHNAQVLVMQVASYSQRGDDMKKLVNLKDFKPRNGNVVR